METFYDHNPTEQEIRWLFSLEEEDPTTTKEDYLEWLAQRNYDIELAYGDIYALYMARQNYDMADIYYNKITDEEYRVSLYRLYNHPGFLREY